MKIAIIGFGKMGQMIQNIAISRGHSEVLVFDPSIGKPIDTNALKEMDMAIEFSTPETATQNYNTCFNAGVSVVSGTTGWLENWEEICKAAKKSDVGFFYASNFSLGVNLLFKLNSILAQIMAPHQNYQTHIEEIHHIQKVDAPSGTAISLAEDVIKENHSLKKWTLNNTGTQSDLPIFSIREGKVTGTHTVCYVSEIDKISIKHEAFGRDGFALGAVLAAEFLQNKKGIFSMKDLLAN